MRILPSCFRMDFLWLHLSVKIERFTTGFPNTLQPQNFSLHSDFDHIP